MRRFVLAILLAAATLAAQRKPAVVLMTAPPLAEYLAATPSAKTPRQRLLSEEADGYRGRLRQSKAALVTALQQRGVTVDSQIETILNAIMIEATTEDLAWVRAQPGVKSATFAGTVHLHLDAATALIGAPAAWAQMGGQLKTGSGIKVGIVDSGIDQTHPMLSPSGFSAPAGFPLSDAYNISYTTNKVIVARNFVCPNPSTCKPTGSTDLSAADGVGHGTFVSSVVGGISTVTPLGTTISGVAPGVWLGNYKVFAASGDASDATILNGINAAVEDGMDVINFSGGGEPGTTSNSDFYNAAIKNAVNTFDAIVVVSAGNCGPSGSTTECVAFGDFTIASPADVTAAISAGASSNSHTLVNPLLVTLPGGTAPANLQSVAAASGSTPVITSNVGPYPLADVTPYDPTKLACASLPANSLTGKIAVIQRGTCPFATKIENAQTAGASAAIIYDILSEPLVNMLTTGASIPSVFISLSDGANLLAFLAANPGALGAVSGTKTFLPQTADLVAAYSSRGPNPDYNIKPDLVAPGDMYAAAQNINPAGEVYDASRFTYAQGTSFAAPMTSGSAAVLRQMYPASGPVTAVDIKSLLVNSAAPVAGTQDGAMVSVMNSGGGRLNLAAAIKTTLTANPVSASFLLVPLGAATSKTVPVTLKNIGTAGETCTVTVSQTLSSPSVQITATPSSIPLTAGGTATLTIGFTTTTTQQGAYEGFVVVTGQSSGSVLRIPYWVMFGIPTVGGMVDAAAYGQSVAPGGIVSLFGTGLGGGATGTVATTVPLPADLAHSTVSITSGGTPANAPLFFSDTGQVNFQMPSSVVVGSQATVSAALQGITTNKLFFTPVAAAPGIFTVNSNGQGAAVVLHANYNLVTAANPAVAGETVLIYCSGLGAVSPTVGDGFAATSNPVSTTIAAASVTIGGQNAAVPFSGLAPQFVGLYQVNATIPANAGSGAVAMSMSISGATSNSVTINLQ